MAKRENGIKKVFRIILEYFITQIIYLVVVVGFYFIVRTLISPKTGFVIQYSALAPDFSFSFLKNCIIRFVPSSALFCLVMLILQFIKRSCTVIQSVITYTFCSCITLFIVLVSLWYYTEQVPGMVYNASSLFKDPDAAGLLDLPYWVAFIFNRTEILHAEQVVLLRTNQFITLGLFLLATVSVEGLSRVSSWRLWNAFFVLAGFLFIIFLNSYLLDTVFVAQLPISDSLKPFVSWIANGLCIVFCSIVGLITKILHIRREREEA